MCKEYILRASTSMKKGIEQKCTRKVVAIKQEIPLSCYFLCTPPLFFFMFSYRERSTQLALHLLPILTPPSFLGVSSHLSTSHFLYSHSLCLCNDYSPNASKPSRSLLDFKKEEMLLQMRPSFSLLHILIS